MNVVLIVVLCAAVALAAFVVGFGVRDRRRPAEPSSPGASPADVTAAVAQALAQLHDRSMAERDVAVRAAVEQAVAMNAHALAAKKDVIDGRLDQVRVEVRDELSKMGELMRQLGASSSRQFGAVTEALTNQAEITATLGATTQGLREALANSKARGQWGERMAEDVLRVAGFVENVNYRKQTAVAGGRGLPDFTFALPKGQVLYMDVKFPLAAYLRYLEAGSDVDRQTHRQAFLRDVRIRVKELAVRDYVAQSTDSSLDYVLLFLPNESISGFIHEHDPALIEDAMRQKVVLCSPLTLFTMLGVIRHAFDNFMVEQTSQDMLRLLGGFSQQWNKFTQQLDKLGRQMDSSQRAFEELNGVRRRQLERPLQQLEELRTERGIALDGQLDLAAPVLELSLDNDLARVAGRRPAGGGSGDRSGERQSRGA